MNKNINKHDRVSPSSSLRQENYIELSEFLEELQQLRESIIWYILRIFNVEQV